MVAGGVSMCRSLPTPLPSCPLPSSPQQVMLPSFSNAHVWEAPAVIAVAVAPPGSVDGCRWFLDIAGGVAVAELPGPVWPQQVMLPSFSNAHVWESPAVIAVAVAPSGSVMGVGGVSMSPVVAPLPSCPSSSLPQQVMLPSFSNAHVWAAPAVIAVAVALPGSSMGVRWCVDVAGGGAVAELPEIVVAPAGDVAGAQQRTRMGSAGGDCGRGCVYRAV